MTIDILELVLITILTAATPLAIAAIGELVTERAGVLNLGVEGMMIMGAATGFAVAILTGSSLLGVLGGIGAGVAMAVIFGLLTIFLSANQVATGLALTVVYPFAGNIGGKTGLCHGFFRRRRVFDIAARGQLFGAGTG